jgi:Prealbumin-like fold domain
MWRCVVGVSLLFLIVCASVARSDSKAGNTGITGVVLVTPIRPGPIRAGSESPTAAPLPNAAFRVTSNQGVVTTFTTDAEGHFRVPLKPGHYSVLLAENRFPKPCGPFEVDVEAGKMTEVEWRCDSGMR